MSITPLRVAIIGAGLGGLCLAQGLKKHGIQVQVYEKDTAQDARRQGFRLRIDKTGQAALAACLPDALFELLAQTCSVSAASIHLLDSRLAQVSGHWVESWHDGEADADLRADRQIMREILLTGLAGQVHFGKALARYEDGNDHPIAVHFEDGSSVEADLLIGADGIRSQVREQRFPGANAADTGTVCCYGKTLLNPASREALAAPLREGTSVIFESGWAVVSDAMCFTPRGPAQAIGVVEDYVYWALIGLRRHLGIAQDDALGWSAAAMRDWISQRTRPWPEPLRALFEWSDMQAATLVAVRSSPLMAAWPSSRVSALGDAMHAMSPAGGLGANCALYDAQVLMQMLQRAQDGDLSLLAAIAAYEAQVRQHSFAAVHASRQAEGQLFALLP